FFCCLGPHRVLPSFPTRRSSDLMQVFDLENKWTLVTALEAHLREGGQDAGFARLRAERREGVRPFLKTQEMQKHRRPRLWRQVRSEEHTSELQSLAYLVCRLLLE